jgi:sucrose-6-phosphate hydrolase SacC (GH32 family)
VSYCAYVDLDRADLFKILRVAEHPVLNLGGLGEFDEFGTYPVSVIRDGDEVRAYYGGWTRCESVPYNVAIGLAKSGDEGVTFTKCGNGPVLSYSIDEPMTLSGPKIRRFHDCWYLWYVAGKKWKMVDGRPESVFKIRMAVSDDGARWAKRNVDLIDDVLEADECQASPDVFFFEDRYHMFFSHKFSSDFRSNARGYRIGYAASEDLHIWARDDSKAGIDIASGDAWDDQSIAYPHVFSLDGALYMLYLGNEVGRFGFGLAVLEGYGS